MRNNIMVFDLECDGIDPYTCSPVEIAAIMINGQTLERIPDSDFYSLIRPPDVDKPDYYSLNESTINFHAKNANISPQEIINKWKTGLPEKGVMEAFNQYINKYNKSRSSYDAPIPAGTNIRNYDLIIIDRLNKKYGIKSPFAKRDRIDILDLSFYWFESLPEPKSYSMDNLRDFFGLKSEGSHTALKDVEDEAAIICRFLKFMRGIAKKTNFKGAFK